MEGSNKATRIELLSLRTPQMRAFHMTWFSFFLCFFAWFGIAPLMGVVREEFGLTKEQVGNTIIASVAITIVARLLIGWLCDNIGPRLTYTFLLTLGSLPVMGIGLAHSYESFLLFRLGIGVIGASFVITQYHTSVMFAPNCVGTANATTAGWGNLGGGATQMIMPLVFSAFVALGFSEPSSWRLSMVVAGGVCFVAGIAYYFWTQDLPEGNFRELRARGQIGGREKSRGSLLVAAKDRRVWALFGLYAACFGIELTINNIAALYFMDYFGLGLKSAGLVAGLFGLMNIFARTSGGLIGDRFGHRWGLNGRVRWLFLVTLAEGLSLVLFSRVTVLPLAIGTMILFSLFVQMSEGATYSVVPFLNRKALGSIAGIVGAGGNLGAVSAGFLFRAEGLSWPSALLILGGLVSVSSFLALAIRFSEAEERAAQAEHSEAMRRRAESVPPARVKPAPAMAVERRVTPLALLRVYLGIALAIKGVYYVTDMQQLETQLGDGFGHSLNLIAWFVVFAHAVGGASLALGFATRLSAALNAVVLVGASVIHLTGATSAGILSTNLDFQFAVFVLVTLLVFLWGGASGMSLDNLLRGEDRPGSSAA